MTTGLDADFRRLWFARAMSDAGTALAMGALPLIAVRTLDASTLQVSILAAAAGLIGAVVALPMGPFLEARRRRPVMITADLVRAALFASVPLAALLGILSFWQLVAVSAIGALGGIVFGGASAAHLKNLVPVEHRTEALGKLESTFWLFNTLGPALGGAIVQLLGTTVTLALQSLGMIASALGISRIQRPEPEPPDPGTRHFLAEAGAGFAIAASHPTLRPLLLNATLFAAFVAWIGPLELVLLLRGLDLPAWQFGIALAAPSLGGLLGSWLAPRVSRRLGEHRTMLWSGLLRGLPLLVLPFLPGGVAGLVLYVVATSALLVAAGVFRPVYSAVRMEATEDRYMVRVTTAFTLASRGAAPLFALFAGLLATAIGVREALLVGVVGLILSGLLLPRRRQAAPVEPAPHAEPVR
ncbi:MFS transporter [Brachybacterium ginsengisoli]|uniref:MFS transporter n=1 Tax=Brachybacterium ginsengisoli TaxID=1331682 RepID=A0A291GZT2_9MICO|nr:MFS transporter [Brachybacterium ginsengisoli]ATG55719.1 MFS transporter [Brachybacterium ginsengisoli]